MFNGLTNNTFNVFQSRIKQVMSNNEFIQKVAECKQEWNTIESLNMPTDKQAVKEWKSYCARSFGTAAELLFRDAFKTQGFVSLKDTLVDPAHHKDLTLGDFLLTIYGHGTLNIDTKFCYTNVKNCYAAITANSLKHFGGWYLLFNTDCDSVLVIYSEYIRARQEDGTLPDKDTYLYKTDISIIQQDAIDANCAFIVNQN